MRRGGGKPFFIFYKNRPAISRAEITDTKKKCRPSDRHLVAKQEYALRLRVPKGGRFVHPLSLR